MEKTASPVVACPACRGPSSLDKSNVWRPFCSERCRTHDMGAWATEDYRVEAAPPTLDPDAPEPPR